MKLGKLKPGIIFLDDGNRTCVKMNPKQRYLNRPNHLKCWILYIRTGGFEQRKKDSDVRILSNGDKR